MLLIVIKPVPCLWLIRPWLSMIGLTEMISCSRGYIVVFNSQFSLWVMNSASNKGLFSFYCSKYNILFELYQTGRQAFKECKNENDSVQSIIKSLLLSVVIRMVNRLKLNNILWLSFLWSHPLLKTSIQLPKTPHKYILAFHTCEVCFPKSIIAQKEP